MSCISKQLLSWRLFTIAFHSKGYCSEGNILARRDPALKMNDSKTRQTDGPLDPSKSLVRSRWCLAVRLHSNLHASGLNFSFCWSTGALVPSMPCSTPHVFRLTTENVPVLLLNRSDSHMNYEGHSQYYHGNHSPAADHWALATTCSSHVRIFKLTWEWLT